MSSLSLALRREIAFEHPLLFPQDGGWLMERVVAVHPDGRRAVALIPAGKEVILRTRPDSGRIERKFTLAWVDLSTGQLSSSREFTFLERELFGFSMSIEGEFLCLIAGQKVVILDKALSRVDSTPAEIFDLEGRRREATSCTFVPGGHKAVLISYTFYEPLSIPVWEWRSSLMQWNWTVGTATLVHWDTFLPDSVPLGKDTVLVYRSLPDWLKRFQLEEVELSTQDVSWGTEFKGFAGVRLIVANNLMFRVGSPWRSSSTTDPDSIRVTSVPERFRDRLGSSSFYVRFPRTSHLPEAMLPLPMDGRVMVTGLRKDRNSQEYRVGGAALFWPLSADPNEKWFVVRAVRFSHVADNWTLQWSSNYFVAFSLDGSKRRLYTSEKFGADEAITGFAVSPDGKALLVATSKRLLVYSVEPVAKEN